MGEQNHRSICSRFTVCPFWPLGNQPQYGCDDRPNDNLLITNQLVPKPHRHMNRCETACKGCSPSELRSLLSPDGTRTRDLLTSVEAINGNFKTLYHRIDLTVSSMCCHTFCPIYLGVFKGSYSRRRDISS